MGFLFVSNLTNSCDENRRTLLKNGPNRYTLFQEGLELFQSVEAISLVRRSAGELRCGTLQFVECGGLKSTVQNEQRVWDSAVHTAPDLFSVPGGWPRGSGAELTASILWSMGFVFWGLGSPR